MSEFYESLGTNR